MRRKSVTALSDATPADLAACVEPRLIGIADHRGSLEERAAANAATDEAEADLFVGAACGADRGGQAQRGRAGDGGLQERSARRGGALRSDQAQRRVSEDEKYVLPVSTNRGEADNGLAGSSPLVLGPRRCLRWRG